MFNFKYLNDVEIKYILERKDVKISLKRNKPKVVE